MTETTQTWLLYLAAIPSIVICSAILYFSGRALKGLWTWLTHR